MNAVAAGPPPEFDAYAANYDAALARGLAVSGERAEYFAAGRVAWLARCLERRGFRPQRVLDFGCGTGTATPYLLQLDGVRSLLGLEVSAKCLDVARQRHGSARARFALVPEHCPAGDIDLAFCNGVFHHIPPAEHPEALAHIHRSLRSGGLFAFWENNPWNPGTHFVMSRIPFDRDAICISCRRAHQLLRAGGFEVLQTDFLFYFPRALRWLRGLEPWLVKLPLGAQYQVLCRKP